MTKAVSAISIALVMFAFGVVFQSAGRVHAGTKKHTVQLGDRTIHIPDEPASGTIKGLPFQVQDAEIDLDTGVFTIRQGEDFFMDSGLKIFLRRELEDWKKDHEALEGFTVSLYPGMGEKMFNFPQTFIEFKEEGKRLPSSDSLYENYYLFLFFGAETEPKRAEGKIYFRNPKDGEEISGAFKAEIDGYREINGVPDLTMDSDKLLLWLAREYLKKKYPESTPSIKKSSDFLISSYKSPDNHAENTYPFTGRLNVTYTLADEKEKRLKFQFFKEKGIWKVHNVLDPRQFFKAHLIEEAMPKSGITLLARLLEMGVARKIESELESTVESVYDENVEISSIGKDKAIVFAVYKTDPGKIEHSTKYIFVPNSEGWTLKEELPRDQWTDYERARY